jgi:ABC-type transporter Mla subunit MlaD
MEATLQASIESFRVLEYKLNTVFQSLNQLSIQRAEGLSEFEAGVDVMGGHNLQHTALIQSLGETAARLSAHQEGVTLDKTELDGLCTELQNRLQEAEALTSTLSGLVSTVEQELNNHASSESLNPQGEVEVPSISPQVAAHLSKVDDVIALHRETHQSNKDYHADQVQRADERLDGFDRALQELLRADDASKARHQARSDKGPGGIVLTMPSFF